VFVVAKFLLILNYIGLAENRVNINLYFPRPRVALGSSEAQESSAMRYLDIQYTAQIEEVENWIMYQSQTDSPISRCHRKMHDKTANAMRE
jgi:hypothetical protein